MTFENINAVFPSVLIFFIFFFEFLPYSQYALLNVLFRFFSFLNSFKRFIVQQINMAEVEYNNRI